MNARKIHRLRFDCASSLPLLQVLAEYLRGARLPEFMDGAVKVCGGDRLRLPLCPLILPPSLLHLSLLILFGLLLVYSTF